MQHAHPNQHMSGRGRGRSRCALQRRQSAILALALLFPSLVSSTVSITGVGLWPLTLASEFVAQSAWLVVPALIIAIAGRTRLGFALGAVSVVLLGFSLLSVQRLPRVDIPEIDIRVLAGNLGSRRGDPEALRRIIVEHEPDIVAMCELSGPVYLMLESDEDIHAALPHRLYVRRRAESNLALLSRWPLRRLEYEHDGPSAILPAIVEHPRGEMLVVGTHLISPRTAGLAGSPINAIGELVQARAGDHAVLLAGDFNTTPTGVRARDLSRVTGLRRAKPLFRIDGSFPAQFPAPARLAIDGVVGSETLHVAGFRTIVLKGSDHRATLVELVRTR